MKKEYFIRRGMSVEDVNKLFRLVRLAGKQNVGYSNGDAHPSNADVSDRDFNCALWGYDFNESIKEIQELVEPHGFLVLCDGIFPSFEVDGRIVFAEVN